LGGADEDGGAVCRGGAERPQAKLMSYSFDGMSNTKPFQQLRKILPAGEISFEPKVLDENAGDKWFASHRPDAVAFPKSTKSVSAILKFANKHRIPVTPRGAGYGYVGGAVPIQGGIVLSLARMNRIKEINAADFVAVAEAGVITKDLQDAVEKRSFIIHQIQRAAPIHLSEEILPQMRAVRVA